MQLPTHGLGLAVLALWISAVCVGRWTFQRMKKEKAGASGKPIQSAEPEVLLPFSWIITRINAQPDRIRLSLKAVGTGHMVTHEEPSGPNTETLSQLATGARIYWVTNPDNRSLSVKVTQ